MRFARLLLSPYLWVVLLGIAGAGLIVIGVSITLGTGPGYIAAGAFVLALTNFIRKGLT